jgi:hypothetical protein
LGGKWTPRTAQDRSGTIGNVRGPRYPAHSPGYQARDRPHSRVRAPSLTPPGEALVSSLARAFLTFQVGIGGRPSPVLPPEAANSGHDGAIADPVRLRTVRPVNRPTTARSNQRCGSRSAAASTVSTTATPCRRSPPTGTNVAFTGSCEPPPRGWRGRPDVLRLLSGRAASAVAAVRTPVAALRAQLLIAGAAET